MVVLTFDSYTSLTLYMHDYDACTRDPGVVFPATMGFNTINPPIKIKLASCGTLDMVNVGCEFISDVKLTSKQKSYIANVDETKCVKLKPIYEEGASKLIKPSKEFDYELEEYWPLTSRMRGYTVTFKHCSDTDHVNDHWVRIIRTADRCCKQFDSEEAQRKKVDRWPFHDMSEESEEENDEEDFNYDEEENDVISVTDSEDNMSSTEDLQILSIAPKVVVINLDNGEKVAHSNMLISTENMFKQAIPITMAAGFVVCNLLVIENMYESCDKCTVKNYGENIVVEMFNTQVNDGKKITTVRVLTMIIIQAGHCNAVDVKKYEKSGYGESGVNFYKNASGTVGIVFSGNQDDDDSYNYAMAMDCEMVVPDLLLSDEAIANINNFSPPVTNEENRYWYKYKEFKKALLEY